jgi:hypothetical protein
VDFGTNTDPVRTDPTGTTTQPVSGTVTANLGTLNGAALDASVTGLEVAQASTTSGQKGILDLGAVTTSAPTYTTAQSSPLSLTTAGALRVDGSGATQPVSGTVTANAGTGNFTVTQSTGTNLHVVCDSGCSSSAGFADNGAFTTGTTAINPVGGLFDDTPPTAITTGHAASARITNNRALHINIRNQAGTELATATNPVRTDPTGTTTQPVSGTVTANIGTSGSLALDASVTGLEVAQASTTSGQKGILAQCAVTTSAPTYTTAQTDPLSCGTGGLLRVDGSGATQPVSGTVTANAGTGTFNIQANASVNEAQVGGSAVSTAATGVQKVGVVGNAGAIFDQAPGSAVPANVLMEGLSDGTNARRALGDATGRQIVKIYPDTTTASYHASANVASAASATDVAVLPGNATNTVLVYRVTVSCSQTTAGLITLQLIKRSTADTAGTSANMTVVPDDSGFSAGSSVPKTYTANPTAGTPVGNVDTAIVGCMATGTAAPNDIYIFKPAKPILLRGVAEQLAVNLNAATVTGGSFDVTFDYAETTTP